MSELISFDPGKANAHVYYHFINARQHDVYLVKVDFPDVGMFVNSITVQPSPKNPSKIWVQQPRFFSKGFWIWPLQFRKAAPLWKLLEKLALEAVDKYSEGTVSRHNTAPTPGGFVAAEKEFL